MGRRGLLAMTIPDYVAFGVLIVLFVVNVVAVLSAATANQADQTNAQNNRFVSRS